MEHSTRRKVIEVLALFSGVVLFAATGYFGLAHLNAELEATGHPFLQPETWVDHYIPLAPAWIWVYVSYYPMLATPLWFAGRLELMRRITLAFAIEFGVAFALFYSFPMRMAQPAVLGDGWSEAALRFLFSIDPGYNIFPSLHVANAVLVACIFWRLAPRPVAAAFWVWAVLVCASTVLVKQHYFVDIPAGVLLALLAYRLAFQGLPVGAGAPGATNAEADEAAERDLVTAGAER